MKGIIDIMNTIGNRNASSEVPASVLGNPNANNQTLIPTRPRLRMMYTINGFITVQSYSSHTSANTPTSLVLDMGFPWPSAMLGHWSQYVINYTCTRLVGCESPCPYLARSGAKSRVPVLALERCHWMSPSRLRSPSDFMLSHYNYCCPHSMA
jgi:hypothetical protein